MKSDETEPRQPGVAPTAPNPVQPPPAGRAEGPSGPSTLVDASGRTDVTKALMGQATYRSLGEQRLSPAEERFERARRTTGLWLAPLVAAVFLALPLDMAPSQQTLAGILLGVIVLWVTEPVPIPVGGLIGVAAIVVFGVVPPDDALSPFGSPTIFMFIGAFILAQAMLKHGVARRFAFFVLSLPGVGRSTFRLIVAFGVITCLLSAFVSNTTTVAMLLPTALGLLTVIAKMLQDRGMVAPGFDPARLRVGAALVLMLAYGAGVGGLLTASAAVVVPIIIPIAAAAQVDPFVPALAATFAASFGFMLPVSTPQNAIAYGSGVVPITTMIRSGFTFDVIGALLIILGLPLMVALTGIGG
ncbi:SLC13 family permease [Actinomadura sp. SCN-SB]|uniref:SLC13 family permease n=1 Tax=Actinomadura sp. SCN-SB TaxID=3373092 RepID=UPI003750141A